MKLMLTSEEGTKMVEALYNLALKNGWEEDDLEDSGVMEEYSAAVDAALNALGIELCVYEEDEDEDEDEDTDYEDEDDDTVMYSLTPKGTLVAQLLDEGYSLERACKIANILFPCMGDE